MPSRKLIKFIGASPAQIFDYFTNSTNLKDWLCDVATADPHPEGRLYMCWNGNYYTSGEYLSLVKDKTLSFTWFGRGEPHATQVDIRLEKKRRGTLVKLFHRKLSRGDKWNAIGDEFQKEWLKALDNLASVLETGADLRITTRPMLGIYLDDFNAEIAAKQGIPVSEGVRLSGVVDGMGAQVAGLQAEDVIVGMDDQEITGYPSLSVFISGKQAGDYVRVKFYRSSELKTLPMKLSGRPIPAIPASGSELSKQLEPELVKLQDELEETLSNVSPETCAIKPAAGEWSVNQILAHLIHGERGWHNHVEEIINSYEAAYDDYSGNLDSRVEATVQAYPSTPSLVAELKSLQAETLSFYTLLPHEFMARKGKFWKLVYEAAQNPSHLRSHLEQIRTTLQSVRSFTN